MIRLNRNESSFDHPREVLLSLSQNDLRYYDDSDVTLELMKYLSHYANLPESHLMIAAGSTNFLRIIPNIYIGGPEDEVVTFFPTYIDFVKAVSHQRGTLKPFHITPNDYLRLKHDEDKQMLLKPLITDKTRLIYVCNPNNPIDFRWTSDEIKRLCLKYTNIIILVDQAYYEFQNFGDEIMSWAGTRFRNLLVTRTFSKAFGLAGLRFGYLGGHPDILRKCHDRYVVNREICSLTKRVVLEILKNHLPYYREKIKEIKTVRRWTVTKLKELKFELSETEINFLTVKVDNPDHLTEYLKEKGILVRNVSQEPYNMAGYIRISLGSFDMMNELIVRMGEYLSKS